MKSGKMWHVRGAEDVQGAGTWRKRKGGGLYLQGYKYIG